MPDSKSGWCPDVGACCAEHLERVCPGRPIADPAPFMQSPLKQLWRWKRLGGRGVHISPASVDHFALAVDTIADKGPLSIALPSGQPAHFLAEIPKAPQVSVDELPEAEAAVVRAIVAQGGRWPHASGEASARVTAHERAKEEHRAWLGDGEMKGAWCAIAVAREHNLNFLSTRVWATVEGGSFPALTNELCCWKATACSAVVSMVLEFSLQARGRFGLVRPMRLMDGLVERWSEPGRLPLATVGDLLWMRRFYGRWVQRDETLDAPKAGSSLPLLLRNPLFILDDVQRRVSHYPSDAAAQRQMLLFLATSSHSFRKHLIERLVTTSVDGALAWVRFLDSTVKTWASKFSPLEKGDEPSARQFLEDVLRVWRIHVLRAALLVMTVQNPGRALSDIPDGMTLLGNYRALAREMDSVDWPMSSFDAIRWCGIPSFPVCFKRENTMRYAKMLDAGSQESGDLVGFDDEMTLRDAHTTI